MVSEGPFVWVLFLFKSCHCPSDLASFPKSLEDIRPQTFNVMSYGAQQRSILMSYRPRLPRKMVLNPPFPIRAKSYSASTMCQTASQAVGTQKWTQKSNIPALKELTFWGHHHGQDSSQDSRIMWWPPPTPSSALAQTQEEKHCPCVPAFKAGTLGKMHLGELRWTHTSKDSEKHIVFPQSHLAILQSPKIAKVLNILI